MESGSEDAAGGAWAAAVRVEPTGIPGLDAILGGGLARGSLVLLAGPPGTGKTTLAAHLAFAAARAGRRVVFVTALAEPTDKLLAHLRSFAFYDEAVIADRLQVLSLVSMLPASVPATADQVTAEVRRRRADLLVLDGFRGVRLAAESPLESREFLYAVGGALGVLGATTVITAEAELRDGASFAEATGADVLLALSLALHAGRPHRTIEPIKLRGAAPLLGLHGLAVDAQGAAVYPRLEARVLGEGRTGAPAALDGSRASFGLPELDALLGGGLTRGTSTLVLGSPGTGKTLLSLHFALAGVAAGEPAVFLGFHEDEDELRLKADAFALGDALRRATAPGGGLALLRQPPIELEADLVAHDLLAAVDRAGARRVVVDSLVELVRAVEETTGASRVPNYLAALIEALRRRRVTALLTQEHSALTTAALSLSTDPVSVVAANLLWLQQVAYQDQLHRVLSVPKMRFSAHDTSLREFALTAPEGLVVRSPFQSESGMLTELARVMGGVAPGERVDAP